MHQDENIHKLNNLSFVIYLFHNYNPTLYKTEITKDTNNNTSVNDKVVLVGNDIHSKGERAIQ